MKKSKFEISKVYTIRWKKYRYYENQSLLQRLYSFLEMFFNESPSNYPLKNVKSYSFKKIMTFYYVFPECKLRRKIIIWTLYITGPDQIFSISGFSSNMLYFRIQVRSPLLPGSGRIFSTSGFRSDLLHFRIQVRSSPLPGLDQSSLLPGSDYIPSTSGFSLNLRNTSGEESIIGRLL